jgi:hypothetical protein
MIVTFAHTKGGVRKTTSAVGTALAAHRAGLDVELMDTAPPGRRPGGPRSPPAGEPPCRSRSPAPTRGWSPDG